jgi:hypothetical protein
MPRNNDIDVETINKVVAEASRKTGIPRETMEKAWDALCAALEPYVRAKYSEATYTGKVGKA